MKIISYGYWMSHECGQAAYEPTINDLLGGDAGHVRAPLELEYKVNNENTDVAIFQQGVME